MKADDSRLLSAVDAITQLVYTHYPRAAIMKHFFPKQGEMFLLIDVRNKTNDARNSKVKETVAKAVKARTAQFRKQEIHLHAYMYRTF